MQDKALLALLKAIEDDRKRREQEEQSFDPAKQAEGYKKRLEGSGIPDIEDKVDQRGPIKKLLNLREKQNPLFDFFEIINRPQQALFGAVHSSQKGKGFGEGLKAGITGESYTRFKNILNEAGIGEEDKFGVDSVLGFAGDVFLDPMNWAMIGSTAGSAARIAKATDRLTDATKGLNELKKSHIAAKKALDAAKESGIDKAIKKATISADNALARFKDAKDQVKVAEKILEAVSKPQKISPLRYGMRHTVAGFTKTGKYFDSQVSSILTKLDNLKLDMAVKAGEKTVKQAEFLRDAEKHLKMTGLYRGALDQVGRTFNALGKIPGNVIAKSKEAQSKINITKRHHEIILDRLNENFVEHMKKSGFAFEGDWHLVEKGTKLTQAQDIQKMKDIGKFGAMVEDVIEFDKLDLTSSIAEQIIDEGVSLRVPYSQTDYDRFMKFFEDYKDQFQDLHLEYKTFFDTVDIAKGATEPAMKNYFFGKHITDDGQVIYYINQGFRKKMATRMEELFSMETVKEQVTGQITDKNLLKEVTARQKEFKRLQELRKKVLNGETVSEWTEVGIEKRKFYNDRIHKVNKQLDKKEKALASAKTKKDKLAIEKQVKELTDKKLKLNSLKGKLKDKEKYFMNNANDKVMNEFDALTASNKTFYESNKLVQKGGDMEKIISDKLTGDDFQQLLSQRFESSRFYGPQDVKKFDKMYGYRVIRRGKRAGERVPIEFEKLTPEQRAFREAMEQTMEARDQILSYHDEVFGSGLSKGEFGTGSEGWLHHAQSVERKAMSPKYQKALQRIEQGDTYHGNMAVLAKRKWKVSRLEANKLARHQIDELISQGTYAGEYKDFWMQDKHRMAKLFEDDMVKSWMDFIETVPKSYGETDKMVEALDAALIGSVKSDKLIKRYDGNKIPGYELISRNALVDKLKMIKGREVHMNKITEITEFLNSTENFGNDILIEANILNYVGRLSEPKELGSLMKMVKSLNTMFKKHKLLSPGFQLRNFVGNWSRAWLAGMSNDNIIKYGKKAHNVLMTGDELFKKKILAGDKWRKVLTKSEKATLEIYEDFLKLGFNEIGRGVHDIPEHLLNQKKLGKSPLNHIAYWNGELNWKTDRRFRLGMYLYGKDNPEFVLRYGTSDPAQVVRYALFDYSDLSDIEKNYIRNVIPFYTFTKKNLAFQFKNIIENPERFNKMTNAFDSLWYNTVGDMENANEYMRQNYWFPIPIKDKDGNYRALKSSLPTGNLGEFMEKPIHKTVAATAPYIRAPFEWAVNRQTFSGMPIQEFEGQKGFSIPELNRKQEFLLSQSGFDVPVKHLIADPIRSIVNAAKGEPAELSNLMNSFSSVGNVETTQQRQAYDQLDHMRDLMKYYKQEGVEIMTLAEIENRDRNKQIAQILNRLKQLSR